MPHTPVVGRHRGAALPSLCISTVIALAFPLELLAQRQPIDRSAWERRRAATSAILEKAPCELSLQKVERLAEELTIDAIDAGFTNPLTEHMLNFERLTLCENSRTGGLPPFEKALFAMFDARRFDPCTYDPRQSPDPILDDPRYRTWQSRSSYDDGSRYTIMVEGLYGWTPDKKACLVDLIRQQITGVQTSSPSTAQVPTPAPAPSPAAAPRSASQPSAGPRQRAAATPAPPAPAPTIPPEPGSAPSRAAAPPAAQVPSSSPPTASIPASPATPAAAPSPASPNGTIQSKPGRSTTPVPGIWNGSLTFGPTVTRIRILFKPDFSLDLTAQGRTVASGSWSRRSNETVFVDARHQRLGPFTCELRTTVTAVSGRCTSNGRYAGDIALAEQESSGP